MPDGKRDRQPYQKRVADRTGDIGRDVELSRANSREWQYPKIHEKEYSFPIEQSADNRVFD